MTSFDPNRFRATHTLRNGIEVTIRAIRHEDRARLAAAFRKLDRESVYTRFFRYVSELSDDDLRRATETDPARQVALVVTVGTGAEEIIIAGGRYVIGCTGGEPTAEIAFTVEEDYQGLGLASTILSHLIEIARERGVAYFEADVLSDNRGMLRVFARSGLPMERRQEGGVVHVRLALGNAPPSAT
jgi:GNAT superfamily N-acetyltransferase